MFLCKPLICIAFLVTTANVSRSTIRQRFFPPLSSMQRSQKTLQERERQQNPSRTSVLPLELFRLPVRRGSPTRSWVWPRRCWRLIHRRRSRPSCIASESFVDSLPSKQTALRLWITRETRPPPMVPLHTSFLTGLSLALCFTIMFLKHTQSNNRTATTHSDFLKTTHSPVIFLYDFPAARAAPPCKQEEPSTEPPARRRSRNRRTMSKRAKLNTSTNNSTFHHKQQPPQPSHGLKQTLWSPSDASQSTFPMPYPVVMPGYPLQVPPRADSTSSHAEATPQGFRDNQSAQAPPSTPSLHSAPFTPHMVTPVMALVLPNYLCPLMSPGHPLPPSVPVYQVETVGIPAQMQPFDPGQGTFTFPPSFSALNPFNAQNQFTPLASYLSPPFYFPASSETPKPHMESHSCSSTPQSGESGGQAYPPLFHSRCSSPLNLLELELSVDRQDNMALSSGGQGVIMAEKEKRASGIQVKEKEHKQVNVETNPPLTLSGSFHPQCLIDFPLLWPSQTD